MPLTGTVASGFEGVLGIREQFDYDVAKTPSTYFMDMYDETLKGDNGIITKKTCQGKRSLTDVIIGPHTTVGGFKIPARPNGFMGLCLKGLFGQVVTTDLGGGAYQHVFEAVNSAEPLPFTVYVDRKNVVERYTGFVFGKLDINGPVNDSVDLQFDGLAQKPDIVAQQTSTFDLPRMFVWCDATITYRGVVNKDFEDLTISINNTASGIPTINGTRFIQRAIDSWFEVEASWNMGLYSADFLKQMWGDVAATSPTKTILENTFEIEYVSPEEIASSGEYYTFKIEIPAAILLGDEPVVTGADQRIMQPIRVVGKSDGTKSIKITLINAIPNYDSPLS